MPASSSALYYPNIDIKNETWLKSALLYWDSIFTISPISIEEPYRYPLSMELKKEGFLKNISVSSSDRRIIDLEDEAIEYLTNPNNKNAIENYIKHEDKINNGNSREILSNIRSGHIFSIHPEKLGISLRKFFRNCSEDDGFLESDAGFSNFYMTLLAKKIATAEGLSIVSDSANSDHFANCDLAAKSDFSDDLTYEWPRRRRSLGEKSMIMIHLTFSDLNSPHNRSTSDILKFKEKHKQELYRFRNGIEEILKDLPEDLNTSGLERVIKERYDNIVKPAHKELKKGLGFFGGKNSLNDIVKIASPTPISPILLNSLSISPTIGFAIGAGISIAMTVYHEYQRRSALRNQSPYAYLLSLNNF